MKLIELLVKELPKRGGWPERAKYAWQDWDKQVRPESHGLGFYANELADNHRRRGDANPEPGDDNCVTRAQYEAALAKNDGWIEWGGGKCPLERGAIVDVKHRNGEVFLNTKALSGEAENWSHWEMERPGDIIAYRAHRNINTRANDDRLSQDLNECIGASEAQVWSGVGLPPAGCECELTCGIDMYTSDGTCEFEAGTKVKVGGCANFGYGDKAVVVVSGTNVICDVAPSLLRPLRTEAEKLRDEAGLALYHAINWNAEGEMVSPSRMEDYKKAYDAIAAGKIPGVRLEGK